MKKSYFLEDLNFYSCIFFLRKNGPSDVFYLRRRKGCITNFLVSVLMNQGWCFRVVRSAFYSESCYKKINLDTVNLIVFEIEKRYLNAISKMKIPDGMDLNRIARFLALDTWIGVRKSVELFETAKSLNIDQASITVLIGSRPELFVYRAISEKVGIDIDFYRSIRGVGVSTRPQFFIDQFDEIQLVTVVRGMVKSCQQFVFWCLIFSALRLLGRKQSCAKYDVLAYVRPEHCVPDLNGLFWAEKFRKKYDGKIIAVIQGDCNEKSVDFLRHYADCIVTKNQYKIKGKMGHFDEALFYKICIKNTISLFKVICLALFNKKLSINSIGRLLVLFSEYSISSAFYRVSSAKIGWSTEESHPLSGQGLALASDKRAVSISMSWSAKNSPCYMSALNNSDVFLAWGSWQSSIIRQSHALISKSIEIGYPNIRQEDLKILEGGGRSDWMEDYFSLTEESKIIVFYDNGFAADAAISRNDLFCAYQALIDLIKESDDLFLVVKLKKGNSYGVFKSIFHQLEELVRLGRCAFRSGVVDFESAAGADVVVGFGISSPAVVVAQFGVPALLIDRHGFICGRHLTSTNNITTVSSAELLKERLLSLLAVTRSREISPGPILRFCDLGGADRTALVIKALRDQLRESGHKKNAIDRLDELVL